MICVSLILSFTRRIVSASNSTELMSLHEIIYTKYLRYQINALDSGGLSRQRNTKHFCSTAWNVMLPVHQRFSKNISTRRLSCSPNNREFMLVVW